MGESAQTETKRESSAASTKHGPSAESSTPGPTSDHARALRDAGLKATGPRRKVLDLFDSARQRHATAEEVYAELEAKGEHISLATVYRVLAQFESAGLLSRHHLEDGKTVYELSRLGDHNHLICAQCGKMTCFTDREIDVRQRQIAREHGFELKEYSLYTYVNCLREDCPNRESED